MLLPERFYTTKTHLGHWSEKASLTLLTSIPLEVAPPSDGDYDRTGCVPELLLLNAAQIVN